MAETEQWHPSQEAFSQTINLLSVLRDPTNSQVCTQQRGKRKTYTSEYTTLDVDTCAGTHRVFLLFCWSSMQRHSVIWKATRGTPNSFSVWHTSWRVRRESKSPTTYGSSRGSY